ncbi:MAG TPA: homoserine kinase [Candidatus Dormibacteraeota bacterium]|nr:homoserine kinase [Candidatus Dormibacteraeota bacterium]
MKTATVRVPASSANLGPGFDVLALALELRLLVEARESQQNTIEWIGHGAGDVPLNRRNLIVRAAQEPFDGWSRPLEGLDVRVINQIPVGRGLGSSAAAIVAGIVVGARLRGLKMLPQRVLELALPLEGHGDNLAAALYGSFCVAAIEDGGARVHRLDWPPRWRAVVFVPAQLSPTHEARRLVPRRPAREDAVFNLGRVAEWVLAVLQRDRGLLRSAMDDRLHQPGRTRAYPYLDDMITAAEQAGALGAALSGAGGSVIAIVDRKLEQVRTAMRRAARSLDVDGTVLAVDIAADGARIGLRASRA